MLGAELGVNTFSTVNTMLGVQRRTDGTLEARDALVTWRGTLFNSDTFVWRLEPGVTLPTGGLGSQLRFTPLSSASVDPFLSTDVVVGGQMMGVITARARVPIYDGWDLRRQGAFLRSDLRAAYRAGDLVPAAGVSLVRVLPSAPVGAVPDHAEVAVLLSAVWAFHSRWSLASQVRIPAWVIEGAPLVPSGGIALRGILVQPKDPTHH